MKKFTLLKSLLVVMALSLFSFSAVAETITIDFKDNSLSLPVKDAMSTNEMTFSVDGIEFGYKSVYYNTSKYAMFSKSAGVIYNKTSLGTINSISVTYTSGTSEKAKMNVSYGASVLNEIKTSGYVEQLDVTKSATKKTTQVATGDYFNLSVSNANNVQIETIVIDYVSSTGGEGGDVVDPEPDPEEPTPDPEEPDASEITKVTVAEFLAAEVNAEVWYELTGVISNIVKEDYGNFDLTDATGTVYIFGLTKTQVSSNDKSFASLGLAVNDTVTIRSVRGEYNGVAQGGGSKTPAYFVSVSKYVAPEGGETPDPEDPEVELPEGATQETIDLSKGYENAEVLSDVEALNAILTFAKNGGGTAPAWYTSGSAARLYGKNSLTITAKAGFKLYQVKFGFVTGKDMPDANNSEVTDGTYDYETHTWTAKDLSGAASMSISNKNSSGHFRLQNVVVTYVPSLEVVANPIFSVPSKNFTEPFELNISCVTENAKIYYTFVENGKFEEYTTALNINETTTVYAKAVLGEDESEVVSATYTYVAPVVVTVAEFLAATENDGILYELTGVVSNIQEATYGNFDLIDATGTIYVYGLKANVTASNQTFSQIEGLHEKDTLTLRGYRGAYKGTPQVVNAYYVSHKDYDDPATAVESTKLSDIYTLNRTIVAEGEMEIFTVTGQNVTDMNGNLEKGIYVVRTANAAVKVVVK